MSLSLVRHGYNVRIFGAGVSNAQVIRSVEVLNKVDLSCRFKPSPPDFIAACSSINTYDVTADTELGLSPRQHLMAGCHVSGHLIEINEEERRVYFVSAHYVFFPIPSLSRPSS